jgi:hypothetical protein
MSDTTGYQYLDDVSPEEQARLEAVRRYQLIDQPVEPYERVAAVAGALFDTPIATISMVERDRVWIAACQGLHGVRAVGKEPGLCASVILADDVYVVNNAAGDHRAATQGARTPGRIGRRRIGAALDGGPQRGRRAAHAGDRGLNRSAS